MAGAKLLLEQPLEHGEARDAEASTGHLRLGGNHQRQLRLVPHR